MVKFCPNCGNEINDDESVCSSCGFNFSDRTIKDDSTIGPVSTSKSTTKVDHKKLYCLIGIAVIFVIIVAFAAMGGSSDNSTTTTDTSDDVSSANSYTINGVEFILPSDVEITTDTDSIVNFKRDGILYYITSISDSEVSSYTTSSNGYVISGPRSSDNMKGELYTYIDTKADEVGTTLIISKDSKIFIIDAKDMSLTSSSSEDQISQFVSSVTTMYTELYNLNKWDNP